MIDATGILLAGGKNSRMGKNKALIKYGDETFLTNSVKKLRSLFEEVLISVDNAEKYNIDNIRFIEDIYHEKGPMGGIYSALRTAKYDWIFVVPCDMPLWQPALAAELLKHRFDYDIVVPVIKNHEEPLFALYKKTCIPVIEECLNTDLTRVTALYPLVNTNYFNPDEKYNEKELSNIFLNINTKEDLNKFNVVG